MMILNDDRENMIRIMVGLALASILESGQKANTDKKKKGTDFENLNEITQ